MPRVILHAGIEKTGTTYLQHTFQANHRTLAKAGICYPQAGLESKHHYWIAKAFGFYYSNTAIDMQKCTDAKQALQHEISDTKYHTILLSSEHFDINPNNESIMSLLAFFGHLDVILVLRNQLDYSQSLYLESLKWGEVKLFHEFINTLTEKNKLDHINRINMWKSCGVTVHVIDYERNKPNLLQSFIDKCGLEIEMKQPKRASMNATPGIDFMELVRQINLTAPPESRRQQYLDLCVLKDSRLKKLKKQRTWPMPSECKDLLIKLQADNARLAGKLGLDPDSFLGGSLVTRYDDLKQSYPPNIGSLLAGLFTGKGTTLLRRFF